MILISQIRYQKYFSDNLYLQNFSKILLSIKIKFNRLENFVESKLFLGASSKILASLMKTAD